MSLGHSPGVWLCLLYGNYVARRVRRHCPRVFYTTRPTAPHANTPDRQGHPIRRQAAGGLQRHQGGTQKRSTSPRACAASVGLNQAGPVRSTSSSRRTAGRSPTARRGNQYGIRRSRTQAGGCDGQPRGRKEGHDISCRHSRVYQIMKSNGLPGKVEEAQVGPVRAPVLECHVAY